jgi:hypothetical protein
MKIVLDIWGGHHSQDHLARYIRETDDAIEISRQELRNGFLVNMRGDLAWGEFVEFDVRRITVQ